MPAEEATQSTQARNGSNNAIAGSATPTRLRRQKIITYVLVVVVSIVAALLMWRERLVIPLLQNLEGRAFDLQIILRGPIKPQAKPPIALLMVDEKTIREVGSLPIDRRAVAKVVDRLRDDGARWIVFDMLFSEAARRDHEADQLLAQAIKSAGNVLLPFSLGESVASEDTRAVALPDYILNHTYYRYQNDQAAKHIPLSPNNMLAPIPLFGEAAFALGHVSAKTGYDGTLRHDQPVLAYDGEFIPSLAILAATLAAGADWQKTHLTLGGWIDFSGYRVPMDAFSRQTINYYGQAQSFPTFSFADYVAGRLPTGLFKGKVVLIGGTAIGTSDRNPSPFDAALPGSERLATSIDNILTQRVVQRPHWAGLVELLAIILLPIVSVLLVSRLRLNHSLPLLLLVGIGLLAVVQWLFVRHLQIISYAFPLIAMIASLALVTASRAWFDEALRKRAQASLHQSEERYRLTAQGANDGLWDIDIENDQAYYSNRWQQLLGVEGEDWSNSSLDAWCGLLNEVERERFRQQLQSHLDGDSNQLYHVMMLEISGQTRWFLVRGVAIHKGGNPVRIAGSLSDITDQKKLEKQIAFDALHDRLTQLANRDLFHDRLRQLIARCGESPGVGVVLIDIDKFRSINEKYNQIVGNDLLREAALRLKELSKDKRMLLARFGADQFILALAGPGEETKYSQEGESSVGQEELHTWLEQLVEIARSAFKQPFALSGEENNISTTIAAAHTKHGPSTPDELVNAVTLALAFAKQEGSGQTHYFDPAEKEQEKGRQWLADNIDNALAAGDQFHLYYMPFVRLSDRQLIGFEALIRWHHPEKGLVNPGEFIPFAEESGQINEIGRWSLYRGVQDLLAWERIGFKGEIAINISGRQFTDMDLPAECQKMLSMLGQVPPGRVKLEVTESMAMSNPQRATDILQEIADMGFHISIDDFGTGYSSLAYLHRFPFHTLKVDQSFVRRLDSGKEVAEIVRTISGLGRALDKQILAEGVETEQQATTLEELGVQVGQGWLFAKALPVPEATEYIKTALSDGSV